MRLPKHIGVIPDGNRRWAKEHGFNKEDGYSYGLDCGLRFLRAAALSVWFSVLFLLPFSWRVLGYGARARSAKVCGAATAAPQCLKAALVFAKHTPRCQTVIDIAIERNIMLKE